MRESKGKYGDLISQIKEEQIELAGKSTQSLLPAKPPRTFGKRSTAGVRQKSVLLREDSIDRATRRLKEMGGQHDFSDLMQALLDRWLNSAV